jgi:hypothetical protein
MLVNRSVRKFVALVLAGAAVAGVIEVCSGAVGARAVAATTTNQGDPHAVPPILRPASRSELAEIRAAEAMERQAFYYRPPARARYSSAVFNVFLAQGNG